MSKFEDRVREVVDPLVRDIETMFYDEYQAPDYGPILESLNSIRRYVEDIKFELDPVNRSTLKRETNDEQEDDSSQDNQNTSDVIPDQLLLEDLRSLSDLYYDALREQGPAGAKQFIKDLLFTPDGHINIEGFPSIVQLFNETDTPDTISSLLQHYGMPKAIADILGGIIDNVLQGATFKSATRALKPVSVTGPNPFQIGKQVTDKFTESMDSLDQELATLTERVGQLQAHSNDVIQPYLQTIYEKIVECCVKQDVEDLDLKIDNIKDASDEVNFKISSLQPTTNLNNSLNVVTSNKAILAKLRDIRSLL